MHKEIQSFKGEQKVNNLESLIKAVNTNKNLVGVIDHINKNKINIILSKKEGIEVKELGVWNLNLEQFDTFNRNLKGIKIDFVDIK